MDVQVFKDLGNVFNRFEIPQSLIPRFVEFAHLQGSKIIPGLYFPLPKDYSPNDPR